MYSVDFLPSSPSVVTSKDFGFVFLLARRKRGADPNVFCKRKPAAGVAAMAFRAQKRGRRSTDTQVEVRSDLEGDGGDEE